MSDAFASTSPDTRRSHGTSKGSMPPSDRYSMSSFDTGEPKKQESRPQPLSVDDEDKEHDAPLADSGMKSARGSHWSHRSRTSGGFLLSDSTFYDTAAVENTAPGSSRSTPRKRDAQKDKGKGVARNHEKTLHVRKKPSLGLGIGSSSPLSRHVRNVDNSFDGGVVGGDGAQDKKPSVQKGLDIDSANIVNLALNLSESRRQANKRIVTSPLPPAAPTFEDNLAGGSLRKHLQAQRRISRNISPKPDKEERTFGIARQPTERISSPLLQSALDSGGQHQYHFSQATLDRAEKARNSIELMAQYRRLLQYLPPLKPTAISSQTTRSPPSTSTGSPTVANFKDSQTMAGPARQLGRPYNPLQYIRNRKVRARERQPLDGVAEGFGDVEIVTSWVDRIADEAETAGYELSDVLQLPPLIPDDLDDTAPIGTASPELVALKPGLLAFKPKRPKNDWMISGPDMLADVVWLEQNDNKKLIEDNRERKIFSARATLVRMHTDRSDDFPTTKTKDKEESKTQKFAPLKLDTKLPIFKPIRKTGLGRGSRSGSREPRGRHKLLSSASKKVSSVTDGHISKVQMSDSGTSGSEKPMFASLRRKRPRAGTADSFQSTQSYDMGRDVLQKQMSELLKKESISQKNGAPERPEVRRILSAMETHSPLPMDLESASDSGPPKAPTRAASRQFRSGSLNLDLKPAGSGRPSLEVPGHRPRMSLGGAASDFDSTAPNSPESKAKMLSTFIPSLNMDLSSPPSRKHSPTRKPALQRVRSKINRLRDRSAEPDSKDGSKEDGHLQITIPDTPPAAARSPSPSKRFQRHQKRLTTDYIDSPTVAALIAPRAKDDPYTRAAKFRNPLNRVGDMLWKRGHKDYSSASEDEEEEAAAASDAEELADGRRETLTISASKSRSKSPRAPLGKSFLDEMPEFKSPFDSKARGRGRSPNPVAANGLSPMGTRTSPPTAQYQAPEQGDLKEERERKERLRPPRIEIDRASNSSTPNPDMRIGLEHRGSTATIMTEMSSLSRVLSADSRLNQVLGIPGYSVGEKDFILPVTGLAHVDHERARSKSRDGWGGRLKAAEEIRVSRKEIARIRAILLSTGIKAKEIARRADEVRGLEEDHTRVVMPHITHQSEELARLPQREQFLAAGKMIESSARVHHQIWQQSAEHFMRTTVPELLGRVDKVKVDLDGLTQRGTEAADEADELAREVLSRQIMKVKGLSEAIDGMMRKRRRRFRWLRRGGWVVVEWALVGVMWWVWLVVVLVRVGRGFARGILGVIRWLLWL